MICKACRVLQHSNCRGGTWCDCQHVTTGVNINPNFVSTVHQCPVEGGSGLMPCCHRAPFEALRTDRITEDPAEVTCRGRS